MKWLTPPRFVDAIEEQRASVLHSLALFVLALAVPMGLFHTLSGQVPLVAVGVYGALISLQVGVLALLNAGRVTAAALVYVSVYWSLIATLIFFLGGIGHMHASGLIVVTLLAGLSLGTRGALVVGGLSVAWVLVVVVADAKGVLPRSTFVSGVMENTSSLISNVLFASAFVYLSMRSLGRSMDRERRHARLNQQRAEQGVALGRLGQYAVAATAPALAEEVVRVLGEVLEAQAVLVVEQREGGAVRLAARGVPEHAEAALDALVVGATRQLEGSERPAFVARGASVVVAPMPGPQRAVGALWVVVPTLDVEPVLAFVDTVAAMLGAALARDASVAQLQQAQKMEIVGRLAGGIAHDFNNLLTVILGCSAVLVEELVDAEQQGLARDIEGAAHRAALMTQQLLGLSRRRVERREQLDLNVVVRDFQPMLQRLLRADVVVELDAAPLPVLLEADRASLEQVVLNLAVNARDAMPGGGRLVLGTGCVQEGGVAHAELRVQDSGHGMDELTQRRIFEPFFTTRTEGTGLGLATVKGVVDQSGGRIWVTSAPGQGTSFVLRFPSSVRDGSRPLAPTGAVKRGTERVLVVDDDAQVRSTTRRVLERGGYEVLEAHSAEDALEQLKTPPAVALVVTDVVMRGLGGLELGRRATDHGLRVLFVSGFADAFDPSLGPFLAKPFATDELLRQVRALLDGPAPGPARASASA